MVEVNFDGLVGQTHNFAGLSFGNEASVANARAVSNPKAAALQGLAKMKALMDMGLVQGIIPPQERPQIRLLRQLGFGGTDAQVVEAAAKHSDVVLALCTSASSMWVANAATVSPSTDCGDQRVHLTPANLFTKFHRTSEVAQSAAALRAIFPSESHFAHHPALPLGDPFGDEGAANHMRLAASHDEPGVEVFVYGRRALHRDAVNPERYPARQTLEASQLVARNHGLSEARTLFAQQSPHVIDQGVFHNDVIAVANEHVLFIHEEALLEQQRVIDALNTLLDGRLEAIVVPKARVSVQQAVSTYLFNAQLITLPNGRMALVAAEECRRDEAVANYIQDVLDDAGCSIDAVHYFNLTESMRNGGGPACLRLRVVLNPEELARVHPGCILNDIRYNALVSWVERHYRDRLEPSDLGDPLFLNEVRTALDELTELLHVPNFYPFQRM